MTDKIKYGTRKEAVEFYGLSLGTIQKWRAMGIIPSEEISIGIRTRYRYVLDDTIKGHIEFMQTIDKRWSK